MKSINKNVFVFVISFAVVLAGLISPSLLKGVAKGGLQFVSEVGDVGFFRAFYNFTDSMETVSSESLSYHGAFMDINSVFLNAVNTGVVVKDDTTVVKTSSGYLANPRGKIDTQSMEDRVTALESVYNAAVDNGAEFLYVMAPCKGYGLEYPSNVEDYTVDNCDRFAGVLEQHSIPLLNLIENQKNQGITDEEMYFITDHHWKPEYGMWAAGEICSELGRRYGFEYDNSVHDISNYSVKVYEDWFLGSQGKKVGSYFTHLGTDDISIILPEFDTYLTEEQPNKGQLREGTFENTVMYMENVAKKDLYNLNPYVAYSGGDFREQIITNKLNPDGKKILLIRDSFSCAMAPFLSLNTGSLHVADVRDYEYYVGSKIVTADYIKQIKPDYVIVMYSGISSNADLFDFD